jgi:hypothetical protein
MTQWFDVKATRSSKDADFGGEGPHRPDVVKPLRGSSAALRSLRDDGEHGSGTQDSKRRAPSRRPAPISWLVRVNALKWNGFAEFLAENSNIFFLKAGLWLKLKCLARIAQGCGS